MRSIPAVFALASGVLLCAAFPATRASGAAPAGFAVASDNEITSRAALEVMKGGGNAVDAAIAGSLMLGVTAPISCGIGGGGFALVYEAATKKVFALDYRETAPAAYEGLNKDLSGTKIGVPGEVAGLVELHRRFGKRAFADDVAPAAKAAESGFVATKHLIEVLGMRADKLRASPGAFAIFAPQGVFAKENDVLVDKPLAATLRRIGAEGAKAFYEGPIAAELVKVAQAGGSKLTVADLAAYRPVERQPLARSWEGYDVVTFPPPSAGGLMLQETLGLFPKSELLAMGDGTASYIHMVAEGMRGAMADRMRAIGDPAFTPDRTAEMLAPEELKRRRARIAYDRTHAPARFDLPEQGTSHLVVSDAQGNVVTMTTTVNSPFGGVSFAPESGVFLNDELDDFTAADMAKRFGLADGGPNRSRPLARPTSSMTPAIVLQAGAPVLAAGGSGGMRIANNVTEVILGRLVFGKSAHDAVAAPRFFTPPTGPILTFGPGQLPPPAVARELTEKGEQIDPSKWDWTGVQLITFDRSAGGLKIDAAADPRKHGVAIVE